MPKACGAGRERRLRCVAIKKGRKGQGKGRKTGRAGMGKGGGACKFGVSASGYCARRPTLKAMKREGAASTIQTGVRAMLARRRAARAAAPAPATAPRRSGRRSGRKR